jgi:hypothetical protein
MRVLSTVNFRAKVFEACVYIASTPGYCCSAALVTLRGIFPTDGWPEGDEQPPRLSLPRSRRRIIRRQNQNTNDGTDRAEFLIYG